MQKKTSIQNKFHSLILTSGLERQLKRIDKNLQFVSGTLPVNHLQRYEIHAQPKRQ